MGLMLSLQLPNSRIAAAVTAKLREFGVYELPEGKFLTFCPPFIIEAAQIDFLIDALDRALSAVN
jgi:adenosylmethionine-8-amino-7-oxononanoate aminotransferase